MRTTPGHLATLVAAASGLAWICLSGFVRESQAQVPAIHPPSPENAEAPPDPAPAFEAFALAENWVREWRVPAESESLPEPLRSFWGSAVTLRLDGRVIGRGAVAVAPGGSPNGLLARAAREAMLEAGARSEIPRDALEPQHRRELGARMLLSVEVAGGLVPFAPATYDEVNQDLTPGLWGVAARAGERIVVSFPGAMIAAGLTPGAALQSVAARAVERLPGAGSALKEPGEFAKSAGVVFYRFRTTHVAQTAPGARAVLMHRGAVARPIAVMNAAAIGEFEAGVAAYLSGRARDPERMEGVSSPIADYRAGDDATAFQKALVLFALARHAGSSSPHAPPAETEAMTSLVAAISKAVPGDDPSATAMTVLAMREAARCVPAAKAALDSPCVRACRDTLSKAWAPGADGKPGWAESTPIAVRGIVAWALLADASGQPERERWAPLVRSIYRDTPAGALASQLPWLGWAERELAGAGAIAAEQALRDLREALWARQLTSNRADGGDWDMTGALTLGGTSGRWPTWATCRPLSFLATALGDARLTESASRSKEIARLVESVQYLRRLAADDSVEHMYADPAASRWGIRAALWDHRQPVEASAMTLLALTEFRRALDALAAGMPAAGASKAVQPGSPESR